MLRLEIPDEILVRAVADAVQTQPVRINDFAGYLDMNGACKFLSVGETQFKEWVKLGVIHPRKVSTHLVRFSIAELCDFMDQFKIQSSATPRSKILSPPHWQRRASAKTTPSPAARSPARGNCERA